MINSDTIKISSEPIVSISPMDITSYCKELIKNELKTPYIQSITVQDNDVILLHLNEELDFEQMRQVFKEVEKAFPKNRILAVNENIIKGLTILNSKLKSNSFIHTTEVNEDLEEWLNKKFEEIKI